MLLRKTLLCWPLGIFLVLCTLLSLTSAGNARRSISYSNSFVSSASTDFPEYSNGFIRKVGQPSAESRAVHDYHGRTLILKSLILTPLALAVFIIIIILLIPIPVLSQPIGRSLGSSSFQTVRMATIAREVLSAEECMERVSCELSRVSRAYDFASWIPSTLERMLVRNKWGERIIQGLQGTSASTCIKFTCSPAKTLKKSFKM